MKLKKINPIKIYTSLEFKSMCKGDNDNDSVKETQLLSDRTNKSNNHGQLFKKIENTYQLYPELVEIYNKNFNKLE